MGVKRTLECNTSSHNYLCSEAEAALWRHHLFQDMALDAGSADIFIDHTMLQMDVIYCHTNPR